MATIPVERMEEVRELYYEKKLTASQVAKDMNVSLDAVFYFMRHHKLPRRSKKEANANRFAHAKLSFDPVGIMSPEKEKLKMMAVMLYWAEGFKNGAHGVDFANSDPTMILLFTRFLREICRVKEEKLRAYLYCHANQSTAELIEFWSELTGIPKSQFVKPYVREDFDPRKANKMKKGLLHVRYYDKKLLALILGWIGEYSAELQVSTGGGVVNRT